MKYLKRLFYILRIGSIYKIEFSQSNLITVHILCITINMFRCKLNYYQIYYRINKYAILKDVKRH